MQVNECLVSGQCLFKGRYCGINGFFRRTIFPKCLVYMSSKQCCILALDWQIASFITYIAKSVNWYQIHVVLNVPITKVRKPSFSCKEITRWPVTSLGYLNGIVFCHIRCITMVKVFRLSITRNKTCTYQL